MKKKVLFLGASGLIGPYLTPGLEDDYDLYMTDVKPHPDGKPIHTVDVTNYDEVHEAARGMDAIMNFTVNRPHPILSFEVNTRGAWHVMQAAAAHGIKKVIHSGPQNVRRAYDADFDIVDVPSVPSTRYYSVTKFLGGEICRIFARTYQIHTAAFVFNGLGASPEGPIIEESPPIFRIFWEDLQHVCRLALEVDTIPDYYQEFNMHSCDIHGKYRLDKVRDLLGFEPTQPWAEYYKRTP
jgi:nucleoside-diphosphate-sugar epimerase